MRLTSNADTPVFNRTILARTSVSVTALKVDRGNIETLVLSPVVEAITKLSHLGDDWDRCGSPQPHAAAIQRAVSLIQRFYQNAGVAGGVAHQWVSPHVSASEDGEVVLEWWSGTHKLTVYVDENSAQYLKVWGSDIATEMTDGIIEGSQFQGLWLWLNA